MKGSLILGFSLFLLVYFMVNGFIGWRGYVYLSAIIPSLSPAAYGIGFALVAVSYIMGRMPLPNPLRPAGRLLKVLGSYYFAIMEWGLLLLVLADLVGFAAQAAGIGALVYREAAGWIIVLGLMLLLIWGSYNAWSPVVRTYPVLVDKRVPNADALRIVAASDLHLGNIVGKRHLKRLIERVNALEPDLILLPGDVIDDSIEPFLRNRLDEWLKLLKARYGVYAVLGNHEYYGGHIEEYVGKMREIGIPVLRDETAEAGPVIVAGRKDKTAEAAMYGGRMEAAELLRGADRTKPIILMDHQPYGFDKASEAGVDLLLCGHTHRGQFAPNHWITKRMFELDWGYMRKGAMHVVVSSGFGSWGPPVRLASRSEIVLVEMKFMG